MKTFLETIKHCMSVMLEVEYLVGLSVIIQVEQVPIIGLKMKLSVLVKNVQFDSHLQNEDIIAGKNNPFKYFS
jgi:hypothetical protein